MILQTHHATLPCRPPRSRRTLVRLYGLTRADADGAVLLRCAYEDFCLELRPADGDGHVEHVAYEPAPRRLARRRGRAAAGGGVEPRRWACRCAGGDCA
jgi:hypothetical protein